MNGRRIIYRQFGYPASVLSVEERPSRALKKDDVLVKMTMMPINPSDLIPIRGAYAHRISLPAVPGYEGVGIVEEVGSNVSSTLIGKRVLPLRGEGTWQDVVQTKAAHVVTIPSTLNDRTAAQLYINPLTAFVLCTDILNLRPKDVVVMNAASSALGKLIAQMSKLRGFSFIAVVRNGVYKEELLQLGATTVVNDGDESVYDEVLAYTAGAGATVAIDSIGGEAGNRLGACVQRNGVFLAVGLLSGQQVNWQGLSSRLQTTLFHLRQWNKTVTDTHWHQVFNTLISHVSEGILTISNDGTAYELANVQQAVKQAEQASNFNGKVFLLGQK